MVGWFLLVVPATLGLIGLALLLNVFGTTDDMVHFYRGRGNWFPVLEGDEKSTHRLIGVILLLGGVVTAIAVVRMGIL
jgi:hypothetical protein